MTVPNPPFDHLYRPYPELALPQGQRGWICPVCNAGVSPSVSQHCGNRVKISPTAIPVIPLQTGKWCSVCRSTYFGDGHLCTGSNPGNLIYQNVPTTTSSATLAPVVCPNGCTGQSGCNECP